MTNILLKDIAENMNILGDSVADITVTISGFNKTVSNIQKSVQKNTADIKAIKDFTDDVLNSANNTLVSANNAIESADYLIGHTSIWITIFLGVVSIVLIIAGLLIPYFMIKKSKDDIKLMVRQHLNDSEEFEGQVKNQLKKMDLEKILNKSSNKGEEKTTPPNTLQPPN